MDLPALRSNLGTWAVPLGQLPALAVRLAEAYPPEVQDPSLGGQDLETTYFDTANYALRKSRAGGDDYLTLRLRCYAGAVYALSAKTADQKFRVELTPGLAEAVLAGQADPVGLLPFDLQAKFLSITDKDLLHPVVCVCCRRYAVEDDQGRLSLDVDTHTDTGKCLAYGVLEFKSTVADDPGPAWLDDPPGRWRRLKLSKFLWATAVGGPYG